MEGQSSDSDFEISSWLKLGRQKRDIEYSFHSSTATEKPVKKCKSETAVAPSVSSDLASLSSAIASQASKCEVGCVDADDLVHKEIDLTQEYKYAQLLVTNHGVVCSKYILALARLHNDKLHPTSFVAIIRLNSALYCSCNPQLLEQTITATFNNLEPAPPATCSHLKVASLFEATETIEEWTAPQDRQVEQEHGYSHSTQFEVLELSDSVRLVYFDRHFGTVSKNKCDCSGHSGPCPFLHFSPRVTNERITTHHWQQTFVSWKPIPILQKPAVSEVDSLVAEECPCGSKNVTLNEEQLSLPLFSKNSANICKVTTGICRVCDATVHADGGLQAVLNMGSYLVSHSLLADYCKCFLVNGMTLFCFYKLCAWDHLLTGATVLTYDKLRLAWLAYHNLLDYGSQQKANFVCPVCTGTPEILVCDGITLSFPKRYLTQISRSKAGNVDSKNILKGSSYEHRIMIRSPSLRRQLRNRSVVLNTQLQEVIQKEEPWLCPIVEQFTDCELSVISKPWQQLISDLCASTAAIGMLDGSEDLSPLKQLLVTDNFSADLLSAINNIAPVIYNILRLDTSSLKILKPMIAHLLVTVEYVIQHKAHDLLLMSEHLETAETLPMLPKLCIRGDYSMDKSAIRTCTKKTQKHRTLMPGIFTMTCIHGVCYGFEVMESCESPDIPFTLMRTRFSTAPKTIIYDNSCNLHEYCLNRDPGFFKSTKFYVDRFHWFNHKDCSSGYSMRSYEKLNGINSQVAEQTNAKLKKLRSLVSYCSEDQFKQLVLLFLWFSNTVNILKHRPPANNVEELMFPFLAKFTR